MRNLENIKVVFIIASVNFRDEELIKPKEILAKAGMQIKIASSSLNTATGTLGLKINPDITIEELNVDDFDAIIFVGGGGAREYFSNTTAHKIVKSALKKNKVLGAICIAPAILANAGVLKNVNVTVFSSQIETVKKFGALYKEEEVVVDENIITAKGPESASAFGEAIKNKLLG